MKRITSAVSIAALCGHTFTTHADLPVIDPSVLVQAIQEVQLTIEEVHQITTEVKRLGEPPGSATNGQSNGCRKAGACAPRRKNRGFQDGSGKTDSVSDSGHQPDHNS
jgi:hypothetical protein